GFPMNILAIDTSNHTLGVAILKNKQVFGEYVTHLEKNHSVRLMPAIDQLMREVEMEPGELNKIVIAKGPGSYTGVRIGLTTAKTLSWTLNIPLTGISSIEVLAYQVRFFPNYICPFFDARRQMVYTGLYQWEDESLQSVENEVNIKMEQWLSFLKQKEREIIFLSPDLCQYKDTIVKYLGHYAIFPEETYHIARPSYLGLASFDKENDHPHTLVPNYLRLAEAEANWLKSQKGK